MPIVGMPWSSSMRRPKRHWAGISIKAGCGQASHRHAVTVMLALSFLLWLELRQRHNHPQRGRPRDPLSPLPDCWRRALPAVHREVARWRRHQAVLWWITTDRFMELCSLRI